MNNVLGDVSFFLGQNGIEPQPSYNQNHVSDYSFHWQGVCILPKAKEKIHRRLDIRWVASHCAFIGSLNKNDGDDGATKTSLKKWSRATSNFIALIPSRSTRQMLAVFLELNSTTLYQSSGKLGTEKNVIVLCSCPSQNVKLGIFSSQSCSDGK